MFESNRKYVTLLESELASEKARNKALTDDNRRLTNFVLNAKTLLRGPFSVNEPVAEFGPGFRRQTMEDQIRQLEAEHDTKGNGQ